jgi:diguanylate cyclase (GGDEF)-like protein
MKRGETFDLGFLEGDGEMGQRIRAFDWSKTPIGPMADWPTPLLASLRVMLFTPLPMYIAWGSALTLVYNDAYAATISYRHPHALGMSLREVWDEASWSIIAPEIESALAGRTQFIRDRPHPLGAAEASAHSYYTYCSVPLSDESGLVRGVFCSGYETTGEVLSRESYKAESDRLRDLFDQAPGFIIVLRGPDHCFEIANDAYQALVGRRELIGKPVRQALPELEGQGYFELLEEVYLTGRPHIATEASVLLRRTPGAPEEQRIVTFIYQPIRSAAGVVTGIFVEGSDVTDAVHADTRRKETERLARSTMDALGEHIAVIDEAGTILAVNAAWRAFAAEGGASAASACEGANYLATCDRAADDGDPIARKVGALIRRVATGTAHTAELEYACPTPEGSRWFNLKISRFRDEGPTRIVVAHEDITVRRKNEERIEYLATHDALTGLPNRHLLESRAQAAIENSRNRGLGMALLFLDLDNFKQVNDAYGHTTGDEVLLGVARELEAMVRPGDTIARLGGDELVVLLPALSGAPVEAVRIAKAITRRLSSPLAIAGRELTTTASLGISIYPDDGATFQDLLKNADAALSSAKASGRGSYRVYTAQMSAEVQERVLLQGELRKALGRCQLSVVYQPKVSMLGRQTIGLEALIRWHHPELGDIAPDRFIPVAEEAGLIGEIGRFVMRTACSQARAWQRAGLPWVPIAVNVSAAQLGHPDFLNATIDVLSETGLDPALLELEITEGIMVQTGDGLTRRLHALRAIGVELTIDDFGTGYSNLAYLKAFPLRRLKIDRVFIQELATDPNARSIAEAVLALGSSLGLKVLAEGVETAEQARILIEMGCEEAQGFLYSRPLSPEGVARWFATDVDDSRGSLEAR